MDESNTIEDKPKPDMKPTKDGVKKKRKAPRYWSDQQNDDHTVEAEVKSMKKDVEEIIIDPKLLEKYDRGKSVSLKVF